MDSMRIAIDDGRGSARQLGKIFLKAHEFRFVTNLVRGGGMGRDLRRLMLDISQQAHP
jgi:hypothetical protein